MNDVLDKSIERVLDHMAQELYEQSNRKFIPMYPWVLVRVLPKEQVTKAGIILPAIDQNKTVHEGIVLATWRPFTQEKGIVSAEQVEEQYGITEHVNFKYTRVVEKRSEFQAGDHVLFPHWAGLPIEGFSEKQYRVVRELDWDETKQGGIICRVEYDGDETRPGSELQSILGMAAEAYIQSEIGTMEEMVSLVAAKIEHRFLLIDREQKSVTLSGR